MNPPDESVPTDTETSGAVVHRMTAEEELATALGFARIATEFLLDGDHPNPGTPNGYPPLRTYLLTPRPARSGPACGPIVSVFERMVAMIAIERLADVFVDVADTLVADFDLIEFIHKVARHAAEVSGCPEVGLLLAAPDGELHNMGAVTEDAQVLELLQLESSEGPCLDCYRTGEPVIVPELGAAIDRWPNFAPRALETGIRSVHAFPLRLRDRVIGAMNVFDRQPGTLGVEETRVARALADVAAIAIIQEQAVTRAEVLNEQLQAALNSRIVIEQAKGAVARSFNVSVDQAFEIIRARARSQRVRLTEFAHRLVTVPDEIDLLTSPSASDEPH